MSCHSSRCFPLSACAFIDQAGAGRLVVLLTERSHAVELTLTDLVGDRIRGVEVRQVLYTERSLIQALSRIQSVWKAHAPNLPLISADLDTLGNRILVAVSPEVVARAADAAARAEEELSVPVGITVAPPSVDAHCTSRDHCHDAMWAGVRLYQGAVDNVPECTMGFHISISGNEHFVTSGHCAFLSQSNEWIHPPLGVMSKEGPSLYREGGQDIRYMNNFDDVQASDNIFGCCTDIVGMGSPILNEVLCASLGRTQAIHCGPVLVTWGQHFSSTGGFNVWGARINISTQGGDSGSPVYRLVASDPNENQARAVGANSTSTGRFARLDTSLDDWGASVVR